MNQEESRGAALCEDAGCRICKWRRAHPSESRWPLMQELAACLDVQLRVMAEAENKTNAVIVIARLANATPNAAQIFTEMTRELWVEELAGENGPELAKSLQIIFQVALAVIPGAIIEGAMDMYYDHLREQGEERSVSLETVDDAIVQSNTYLESMRKLGNKYLRGIR